MEKNDKKVIDELFKNLRKELNLEEKIIQENEIDEKQELHVVDKLENLIIDFQKEIEILEEKRLIAVADSQNTVRRFQNESVNIKKYGGEKLAAEILAPIDNFKKVLQSSPEDPQIKNYLMGFEMIVNQIDQALNNAGVQMITTKIGDEFAPDVHNAIEEVETDKVAPGKICAIISNGYKLHDRVIKHAIVKVAKNITNENKEEQKGEK